MSNIPKSALIVVLILIIGGGILLLNRQNNLVPSIFGPTTIPDNTTESQLEDGRVPNNWQTLTSPTHGFTIKYPPDVRVIEQPNNIVTLVKIGPTQQEDTEFYDGINLNFNSGSHQAANFQEFVQNRHNELKASPGIEEIGNLTPTTIAGLNGYWFNVTGLGTFTYIYLPKDQNQLLEIIDATADPTRQGFQQTVDNILSTLTIL